LKNDWQQWFFTARFMFVHNDEGLRARAAVKVTAKHIRAARKLTW
jgi:hypothetical protein